MRVDWPRIETESPQEADDAVGIVVPPLSEMTLSDQRLDRRHSCRNHCRAI